MFEKGEIKYLGKFYVYELIFALAFGLFVPFMTIYFVGEGYSFSQISVLLLAFTLSMVVFEIPTGAFADHYSRKYSTILGLVIMAAGIIPVPLVENFWLLITLMIIQGLGMTFTSGAEEAWVVDNLKTEKQDRLVDDYYIKITVIFAFGGIFSPIIAALIVQHLSIDLLWYLFGAGILISAVYAWILLPELHKPEKSKDHPIIATYKKTFKGFEYISKHRNILFIILGAVFYFVMWAVIDYWQPYFVELTLPDYALGYIYSGMSVITLILPLTLKYLFKFDRYLLMTSIVVVRMLITFSVAFLTPQLLPMAVGIFILSGALSELAEPIIGPMIQKQIPSSERATIMSIYSMAVSAATGLFGLLFGFLADEIGLQKMIVLSGVWGIFSIGFFLAARKKITT